MVDTAAWSVDRVIPEVLVRQWVLSLPYRVRRVCAYDADVCTAVRGILVRAVSGYYERRHDGTELPTSAPAMATATIAMAGSSSGSRSRRGPLR